MCIVGEGRCGRGVSVAPMAAQSRKRDRHKQAETPQRIAKRLVESPSICFTLRGSGMNGSNRSVRLSPCCIEFVDGDVLFCRFWGEQRSKSSLLS